MSNLEKLAVPARDRLANNGQRRMRAAERRRQIIAAAAGVFSAKGFSGATTKEIAANAGINEALLYRHFGGKEALFDAVVEAEFNDLKNERLKHELEAASLQKNDEAVFHTAAKILFHRYRSKRDVLRILIYGILEGRSSVVDRFLIELKPLQDLLCGYIETRSLDGVFHTDDAELAVFSFVGMVAHHATVGELIGTDEGAGPAADAAQAYSQLFLKSLRKF